MCGNLRISESNIVAYWSAIAFRKCVIQRTDDARGAVLLRTRHPGRPVGAPAGLTRPRAALTSSRVSAESSIPLRQTPLHAEHVALGARMVDFGGWSMPVQYTSIVDEHQAVRGSLGVFDISHMGQFFVRGPGAAAWLNEVLTNNVDRLSVGECQYTFLLNERGGVIDDLIVYRIKEADYLLVVNAAKIEEDFTWMQQQLGAGLPGVEFENRSADFAGLAV